MPMATPGMATHDAPYGEIQPLEGAVLLDSLDGIGRAGRSEAARWGQQGRDRCFVEVYRQKQYPDE